MRETIDIDALKARIGDRVVIASVSGGKDSTAMCLHLQELGIPYRAVHMDTGWEHADTDHYVRNVLPDIVGPIDTIKADIKVKPEAAPHVERIEAMLGRESSMVRLVLNRAAFPSRPRRFCTDVLKMRPIASYMGSLDTEPISASGIRAAESLKRSRFPEWEEWPKAGCEQWRPILRWSDQDVVNIHKRHKVPPNPLYLRGAHRVGCWPCIYARKSEIRNLADTDPSRVDLLAELEAAVSALSIAKITSKGEAPRYTLSSFFGDPNPKADPETGIRHMDPWPIRKVVEWAKTKRGGRQFEMFAPPAREWGCMRWGVCDTGAGGDE